MPLFGSPEKWSASDVGNLGAALVMLGDSEACQVLRDFKNSFLATNDTYMHFCLDLFLKEMRQKMPPTYKRINPDIE
jgi:hypothetical protein